MYVYIYIYMHRKIWGGAVDNLSEIFEIDYLKISVKQNINRKQCLSDRSNRCVFILANRRSFPLVELVSDW